MLVRQLLSIDKLQGHSFCSLSVSYRLKLWSRTAGLGNPTSTNPLPVPSSPVRSDFHCSLSLILLWCVPNIVCYIYCHPLLTWHMARHSCCDLSLPCQPSTHPHWSHWDSWQRSEHLLSFTSVSGFKYKFPSENSCPVNQMRKMSVSICKEHHLVIRISSGLPAASYFQHSTGGKKKSLNSPGFSDLFSVCNKNKCCLIFSALLGLMKL